MANQSIGTPRFYLDFTQLAKVKGFFRDPWFYGFPNTNGVYELIDGNDVYGEKNMNVWDFDYVNPTNYTFASGRSFFNFRLSFWDTANTNEHSLEWAKLLSTSNWGGIINHNLRTASGSSDIEVKASYWSPNGDLYISFTEDEVQKIIDYDGYNIIEWSPDNKHLYDGLIHQYSLFFLQVIFGEDYDQSGFDFDIGCMTFGKYIDMPNSPDLKVKKSIIYDGGKIQRSLGGSDFIQVDYQGQPDWLVGEPWSLKDYPSGDRFGKNGRRSWDLEFSYLSNDDLFYNLEERVVGGSATLSDSDGIEVDFNSTSEIQQIWDLTLGGALSFLFTPDKDAANPEYAICRLDQSSLSAKQTALGVWDVKIRVVEVW